MVGKHVPLNIKKPFFSQYSLVRRVQPWLPGPRQLHAQRDDREGHDGGRDGEGGDDAPEEEPVAGAAAGAAVPGGADADAGGLKRRKERRKDAVSTFLYYLLHSYVCKRFSAALEEK